MIEQILFDSLVFFVLNVYSVYSIEEIHDIVIYIG